MADYNEGALIRRACVLNRIWTWSKKLLANGVGGREIVSGHKVLSRIFPLNVADGRR